MKVPRGVDHLRPTNRLRDGDQEVRHLIALRMEGLEEDAPGVADPNGPLSMIRLHEREPCGCEKPFTSSLRTQKDIN